jgi:hypothetical protein
LPAMRRLRRVCSTVTVRQWSHRFALAIERVPRQPGKGIGFSLRRAGCGVDSSGCGFLQAKDGAAAGGLGIAR